jgi:hypothetical protein
LLDIGNFDSRNYAISVFYVHKNNLTYFPLFLSCDTSKVLRTKKIAGFSWRVERCINSSKDLFSNLDGRIGGEFSSPVLHGEIIKGKRRAGYSDEKASIKTKKMGSSIFELLFGIF